MPENFRFQIPAAQDLMPALKLAQQRTSAGAFELSWNALPTARAQFVAAMGSNPNQDMVLWASSEVPETGMALADYQTNPAIDRWLREKVLLAPQVARCTVPAGIFTGEGGGMLKLVAYGSELNLAHPPRPKDPKVRWEPDWAVKIRVKSIASAMLGIEGMSPGEAARAGQEESGAPNQPDKPEKPEKQDKPKALDILRGILGR